MTTAPAGTTAPPEAASPLGTALPWDLVAPFYVSDLLPMFEAFAREALARAEVKPGARVLDVATGPGTLALLAAAPPFAAQVSALDFSPAMLRELQTRAAQARLALDIHAGDGQRLPFASETFDRAFSMFGLMFFPDRGAGFRELLRVLRPGGQALVASWAPFSGPFAETLDVLRAEVPGLGGKGTPLTPLSDPEALESEMAAAGFSDVRVQTVAKQESIVSINEFWSAVQRSTAPVVLLRKKIGEQAWAPIAASVAAALERRFGTGPLQAPAVAFMGLARRR